MSLKQAFPYNTIRIFNRETGEVRNQVGTYSFRSFYKIYTNDKCQHKIKSLTQKYCSRCKPGGYIEQLFLGGYSDYGDGILDDKMRNKLHHQLMISLLERNKKSINTVEKLYKYMSFNIEKLVDEYEPDLVKSYNVVS